MVSAEPGRRQLFRRPRITFAARLLLGGFVLSLAIIAVVSAFLLVSRDQQTRVGAETNAESRAQAYRELVQQVAAPQARFAAQNVAALPEMATALAATDPQTALASLLTGSTKVITDLPDETVAVFDASGTLLATSEQSGVPQLTSAQPEVEGALGGRPAEAIDLLNARTPVYDFAAPVMATGSSQVLGVVVYSMPLTDQLLRLLGAVGQGYTPVILANQPGATLYAISGNPADPTLSAETLPPSIGDQLGRSGGSFAGYSTVPRSGDTALALEGMNPNAGPPVLYVGVETPISLFIGDQTTDELTVVWLALTALLVTWLLVLLFVNRFVRRPVAQLSAGVARIAGGDYGSDIPVRSRDELGVLAQQVNQMRAQIQSNIHHVDAAVSRLDEVSRALTTTTAGLSNLESAVCAAAASLAGPHATALLLAREGDGLVVSARSHSGETRPAESDAPNAVPDVNGIELSPAVVADVLDGRPTRLTRSRSDPADGGASTGAATLVVPMFYRQRVTGAIAVTGPEPVSDADARALSALANNAAIAAENTRLFEMERETVRRLRELDDMKSDFLATAQHELRTPLTAIVGHLELIRMVWSEADEREKLAILDNVELATGQLSDMLETMIDLSLVSADNLRMNPRPVALSEAVDRCGRGSAAAVPPRPARRPEGRRPRRPGRRRRRRPAAPGDPLPARQRGQVHRPRGERDHLGAPEPGGREVHHRGRRHRHRDRPGAARQGLRALLPGRQRWDPRLRGHGGGTGPGQGAHRGPRGLGEPRVDSREGHLRAAGLAVLGPGPGRWRRRRPGRPDRVPPVPAHPRARIGDRLSRARAPGLATVPLPLRCRR